MEEGDLTYRIIGCAMGVHSELGPGLREKPYENASAIEFEENGINFLQHPSFPILYRGRPVGDCKPDFLVEDDLVVECKSIGAIGETEVAQVLNYLRILRKSVELVLDFQGTKLEFKRFVL